MKKKRLYKFHHEELKKIKDFYEDEGKYYHDLKIAQYDEAEAIIKENLKNLDKKDEEFDDIKNDERLCAVKIIGTFQKPNRPTYEIRVEGNIETNDDVFFRVIMVDQNGVLFLADKDVFLDDNDKKWTLSCSTSHSSKFKTGDTINVYVFDSLLPLSRRFNACSDRRIFPFIDEVIDPSQENMEEEQKKLKKDTEEISTDEDTCSDNSLVDDDDSDYETDDTDDLFDDNSSYESEEEEEGEEEEHCDTSKLSFSDFYGGKKPTADEIEASQMQLKLNYSQLQVIQSFSQMRVGVKIVIGPPGSGKTTTIIRLLENLMKKPYERILVTASSNKAVQLLAKRFMELESCKNIPITLIGVKKKITSPSLVSIFFDDWVEFINDVVHQFVIAKDHLHHILGICKNYEEKKRKKKKRAMIYDDSSYFLFKIKKLLFKFLYTFEENILENLKLLEPVFHRYNVFLDLFSNPTESFEEYQKRFLQDYDILQTLSTNAEIQVNTKKKEEIEEKFFMIKTFISSCLLNISNLNRVLYERILNVGSKHISNLMISHSSIIFCTLTTAGRSSIHGNLGKIETLIVDESGQSVEAETLIPFFFIPRKCLLVGDTKQLPAIMKSKQAKRMNFDRSMLWRLKEDCGMEYDLLDEQYRMHPAIAEFPSSQYYENRLKNSQAILKRVEKFPQVKENILRDPISFINIKGKEEVDIFSSKFNMKEINCCFDIVEFLCEKRNVPQNSIGIISFYNAQVKRLKNHILKKFPKVIINSVDGFQGEEMDIILISFVRSSKIGQIGFLKDFRRLNVSITRAKYKLIMVGHSETLCYEISDVSELIDNIKDRKYFHEIQNLKKEIKGETKS